MISRVLFQHCLLFCCKLISFSTLDAFSFHHSDGTKKTKWRRKENQVPQIPSLQILDHPFPPLSAC